MKEVTIKFKTTNDAFVGESNVETARILRQLATVFEIGGVPIKCVDINGNIVGDVKIK